MQDLTSTTPNSLSQDHTILNVIAKQGKSFLQNTRQKSESSRDLLFFQIVARYEKILEQFPDKCECNPINSKQAQRKDNKPEIENYYKKKSYELEKLCIALINVNQDYLLKNNQASTDISNCRINLNYSLSEVSFSNDEIQSKAIKELERQLSECRQNINDYQHRLQEYSFKLQVQNDRYQEQISKLKLTAQLYQEKHQETLRKLSMSDKLSKSLHQQITTLKNEAYRSRRSSFGNSELNLKYSREKTPIKKHSNQLNSRSICISKNEENSTTKDRERMQGIINQLAKQVQKERNTRLTLECQLKKTLKCLHSCERQIEIKNDIIQQIAYNKKIQHQYHKRLNTQQKFVNKKQTDHSRRNSFRYTEVPSNMLGWKPQETITLLNLLNDNLQIQWLDKIKVLYKLLQYFGQKLQKQDYQSTSIEQFSGVNINKSNFCFPKKHIIYSGQSQNQLSKLLKLNLCNIIDKLFQIPQKDRCPSQINSLQNQITLWIVRFTKLMDLYNGQKILRSEYWSSNDIQAKIQINNLSQASSFIDNFFDQHFEYLPQFLFQLLLKISYSSNRRRKPIYQHHQIVIRPFQFFKIVYLQQILFDNYQYQMHFNGKIQHFVVKKEKKIEFLFLINEIDQMNFLRQNAQKMQSSLIQIIKKQIQLSQTASNDQAKKSIIQQFLRRWMLETEFICKKIVNHNNKIQQAIDKYDHQTSMEVNFNKQVEDLYIMFLNYLRYQLRKFEKKLYQKQNLICHKQQEASRFNLSAPSFVRVQQQPQILNIVRANTRTTLKFQQKWEIFGKISQNYKKRIMLEKKRSNQFAVSPQKKIGDFKNILAQLLYKEKYRNQQLRNQLAKLTKQTNWFKANQIILAKSIKNLNEAIDYASTEASIREMITNNQEIQQFYDVLHYLKYIQRSLNSRFVEGVHYNKGSLNSKSCPKNFSPVASKNSQKFNSLPRLNLCKSVTMSFMGHLGQIGVALR